MREIMEHYGMSILGMVSVMAIVGIWGTMFGDNGILSSVLTSYMNCLGG